MSQWRDSIYVRHSQRDFQHPAAPLKHTQLALETGSSHLLTSPESLSTPRRSREADVHSHQSNPPRHRCYRRPSLRSSSRVLATVRAISTKLDAAAECSCHRLPTNAMTISPSSQGPGREPPTRLAFRFPFCERATSSKNLSMPVLPIQPSPHLPLLGGLGRQSRNEPKYTSSLASSGVCIDIYLFAVGQGWSVANR